MRPAQAVMADLASSGLSAEQLALVMELSATVAAEARPTEDRAAQRRRAKDREYQAERRTERRQNRPISADSCDGVSNESNILTFPEPSDVSDETPSPELKPEHVVEAWNATAERYRLPLVRKLTAERRRKLQTRIRQFSIDEFTEAISAFDRSPFLRGENDRGWKPNLDWMLEPKNFTKMLEATYDR